MYAVIPRRGAPGEDDPLSPLPPEEDEPSLEPFQPGEEEDSEPEPDLEPAGAGRAP